MIEGLRPYAQMKESSLPWLGAIPAHWEVRRNGRLFGPRREMGFPELPVLEVSIRTGVRIRNFENGARKQEMSDRSKYLRAARGDIAYNMMRMWQGSVGIAPADGLVSPAYVVARPFAETDAAYYAYLFRTAVYMREIETFSRGIVPDRNRLYWESFKQMPSVWPPLDEQRLIVRFLDWHGGQTAKLIRIKKRLIVLLNEQKQSIIHRAVTRGLDPNVKLKPSGIPWPGDVPEGWRVMPLKRLAWFKGGTGFPVSYQGKQGLEIPFIKVSDMTLPGNDIWIERQNNTISRESALTLGAYIFPKGTIVFPKVGGALLTNKRRILCKPSCIDNNVMGCVAPRDLEYIFLLLEQLDFGNISKPGPVPAISEGEVREIRVAIPPKRERNEILAALDANTRDLTSAIAAANRGLLLVEEYRTRLIADVVTGKLDVRAVAAGLPDVAGAEPIDEAAEGEDLDEEAMDETDAEDVAA